MEYTQNYLDVILVSIAIIVAVGYLVVSGEWRKF